MGKVNVDKTYTKTKTYKSPKMVDGKLSYTLYNDKGENVGQTLVDPGTDMSVAQFNYFTKGDDGYLHMSEMPNTNITLNTETGNIQITAPKSITETDQFKQFIDEDQLKKYSQAYKTNKDYKLSVTEKNEETGEEEEKEVTIPEYIERLNSSLTNYVQNLRSQKIYGYQLVQAYGDKASNLTDTQIVMSAQGEKGAKATYLPDTLFTASSFGNGIDNPLTKLRNKRGDGDEISAEDLAEVWTRDNFGREEVAALMALINGHLEGSDWSKDTYYEDADGNKIYNRNSAEEAAKLIAFKNYILNNNPHAEWYQQAGDWIESAAINFGTAFTNVFANLAVMGEGAVDMLPGVEAKSILNWKNENDETLSNYNEINAQAWDAVVNAQIWGYLTGALTGSLAAGWLGGKAVSGLKEEEAITYTHIKNVADQMASELELSGAAAQALTPKTMAAMFNGGEYATLGTRLWLNGLTAANRSLEVTNATLSAISGAIHANIATEYLFDTLHDAIVFDGSTLRNVIDAVRSDGTNENRQKVINYWMDQFAQNALFWAPLGAAKTGVKLAGKTTAGKAANAVLTKFINKVSANIGYKKMSIRDKLANGSVVKKLESDIEKAIDDNKMTKAMRLQRKLDIENWNSLTRDARRRLGNLELKWEDGQLTPLSLYEFRSYVNDIKVLENGIDAYNRNIVNKIDEYTVKQIDPSTGMRMYLNPDLGETNARVTMYYWDLVDLTKKYNLPIAKDSLLNQDVIDYWMNSFYKRLADKFADSDGLRALDAQNAAVILQKNLDSLEDTVPDEIKAYINKMLDRKVYQNWYMAQNEYGMAKGLLNRDKTIGYQENPIWAEVGYMPIKVQHDVSGKWIPDDGRIDAVIEQDWDSLKFKVAEGQHYADPELVRQSRLRKLAQAEVSKDLLKAYKGFTNSATNVVKITGEQTRYVNTIKGNVEALDTAIDDGAANVFKENFTVRPQLDSDKKLSRNVFVPEDISTTVTAGMSPSQTADFLVQKKILDGPNAKLTDKVTIDNYDDWFRQQSTPVQKYLTQKYSELDIAQGEDIISEELPMGKTISGTSSQMDNVKSWSPFRVKDWSKEDWAAWDELYGTLSRMSMFRSSAGLETKVERVLMDEVFAMAQKQPGGGKYSVAAIKAHILKVMEENDIPGKSWIEEVEVPSAFDTVKVLDNANDIQKTLDRVKELDNFFETSPSFTKRYDQVASMIRTRLNKGAKTSGSDAYADYMRAYLKVKNLIKNGDIAEDGELREFAKQLFEGDFGGRDELLAGEFLALDSIKRGDYDNLEEYADYVTGYHMKKNVEEYVDLQKKLHPLGQDVEYNAMPKFYSVKDITGGKVDTETRVNLARKVARESGGDKVVAWRTQGEGIDNFYGSSGGTQSLDTLANEQWRGGRWVNIGGEPFDVSGYGTKELVFPVNRSDILDEFTAHLYKDSADDVLALKAINPTETQKINKKLLLESEGGVDNIPYYSELSKLDEDTLRKISEGDPRSLLDVTGKKIIKYEGVGKNNREYVIFPDRNPEVLSDGLKDMAKASEDSIYSDSIVESKVIQNPYKAEDILSGKVSNRVRAKLAWKAAAEMTDENGKTGRVVWKYQPVGTDGFYNPDIKGSVDYLKTKGVDLDGAVRLNINQPVKSSFDGAENKNLLVFPVKNEDFLWGQEVHSLQHVSKAMLDSNMSNPTPEKVKKLFSGEYLSDKELEKLANVDKATLKKISNGDPRALLDISDKKIVYLDRFDWGNEYSYHEGIFLFPERNPELLKEGIEAMAKVTGDIDADYPVSASAIRARNKKRLEKLINSQENMDFLNKIGWDRGVKPYQSEKAFGEHSRSRSGHYEKIKANLDEINTLEELESLEVHELAHAAWDRATLSTRKAIGQDLANILGLNVKVDDRIACSLAMNELIAHSMETRFQAKNGWNLLKNDEVTKDYIKKIAGYAGLKPTESFKDRVLTVIRSLVTFIKTKLLGINEAKTFDEFYYGLLNGDFADDLRKGLYEFSHYSPDATMGSLPMQKNLKDIDVPGKKQTVKVSGGDTESSDVPVSIISSKKTPAGETPQMSDEDFIQIASGETVRKIPIKKIQTPAESIFIDTGQPNSFALLERAISEGGDDFEAGLQRAYLAGDKSFRKTSVMNEAAKNLEDGKEAFYQGVIMAKIKGETKNIPKLDVDTFWDEVLSTMRTQIDDYVARVTSSKGAMKAIETLAENSNGAEEAARYIALRQLKKKYMPDVKRIIMSKIDELKQLNKLEKGDVDLLKKKAKLLFNDVVDTELDDATNVARVINSELVDSKDIYDKVKALADEIKGAEAKKVDDYIMYLNDNGDQVFAQVDPAFASLYNTRAKITKAEASWMAKFNAFTSRAFRYGTTSVNLSAFGNQMFRDFGNAVLVGGAWQTIKTNADNLRDVFGDSIVEQIKAFDPDDYEFRQVAKIAEQSGQTMQQAAVSRELMRGSAIAGTTTETSLYRDFMKQAYGDKSGDILNRAEGKLKELWKKYDPDKYMNGKRENYLRNRVYAHSLNDALNEGYTLAQARAYAEFAMNNATTNFSRQLYHMQAIADSTPYFRATINGTKSFWRMWSLDPVGISGRIMGGLILPTMFLTGASLGSEENRKVYQNIPEYQKNDALVFVFNGEPVSIQLPQELSPVVSPFRQFVEYLYGSNKNDFWELMSNDLLGFLPYDMTGFTAIDYDKMIDDPTFFDRTSRGFSRLFSQMAPIPLKSAYMIASGTDPYTGKWLRDPSYAYWNDETNSIEIMDEYQSDFARMFAKLFPKMNPAIADKVVSGVIGTTGSNLLSDITSLVTESPLDAAKGVGEHLFKQATNPVTVEKYNLVDAIWKRAVRQMTNEKNEILSSKEMVKLNNELSQTKDPEKRKKLLAERQNLTNEYKEKVAKMVERLSSEYDGSFDRKKFAAVVALLNFNSDAAYQTGSQYSSDIASEMYWNGRDEAIHTMERMGITGTSDISIFGYLTTNREGEPVMKYSSPTAIMDMKSQWENQNDINAANIKALLSENNMYDAHKAVSDQISKIYDSKKKLTSQDKANIEAIQINWNAQLAKIIAPYVAQMTPEAAINNTAVMNLLYPYVEVPGSWETNDKGKSVYLGERGNKKKAYYDSWIKSLFSVNDKYKGQY